ncbi:hypothetical protein D9757_012613 [Collybiopsis confluens]|uniref:DNase I-like protein n=1 Tax=Collybiopsis confluens TaxID=2823264 RepID=A0A8H5GHL7_9AGAR|nr:hypothetical protein D9757_012613 [Collybiopsis confluens]
MSYSRGPTEEAPNRQGSEDRQGKRREQDVSQRRHERGIEHQNKTPPERMPTSQIHRNSHWEKTNSPANTIDPDGNIISQYNMAQPSNAGQRARTSSSQERDIGEGNSPGCNSQPDIGHLSPPDFNANLSIQQQQMQSVLNDATEHTLHTTDQARRVAENATSPNRQFCRAHNQNKTQNQEKGAKRHTCRKSTKASIKIAALNIRGHGVLNPAHNDNKWLHLRQLMSEKNINIMVVGEAHLDNQRRDEIERIHGKHLRIFFSKLNNTPNAAGVAIVLNKAKTNVENVKTHEVVAGRALLLETRWHNSEKISILGIYAPNTSMRENGEFWEKINNFFERNPRISRPHVMLGDFNMVEEPIDRLPMRNDATIAVDALDNLKTTLQLEDGWRETYPNTLKYTFMRSARDSIKHHARLDRIYNRMDAREKLFEWKIETPGINTDHDLVSVQYTSESTPYTGRGRWVLPLHLLYDKHVKEFIQEEGQRLEERLQLLATEDIWDGQCNAQTEWAEFQINLRGIARERSKIVVPRLTREINILEGRIDSISNDPLLTEEERLLSTTVLKEQLSILEQRKHQSTRTITHARNMVYGETVSRYWSQQNKAKTPRQPIMRLIKNLSENQKEPINTEQGAQGQPNETPIYETQSLKMANMMMDHHNNLQQDEAVPDAESRERAIQATLNHVKICISDASKLKLEKLLTDADVEEALRLSANHKAPGLNGISYEHTTNGHSTL